ncbi:MAG TPA: type IX secretion system sortase PorU, partial [Chitinophagaceae bacterium]|nr:type IX secretion system sortase PorU [Chitinophagaceae bacterium]
MLLSSAYGFTQRLYKSHSVLSTGNWTKIGVREGGVYKMDAAFLTSLGIGNNIQSTALRIYGNSGAALPEANNVRRIDDLEEIAITIVDGGDGVMNNADYVLFFAPGPHQWFRDTITNLYYHKKNIYSDKSYYFVTVGGIGKRIENQSGTFTGTTVVNSFDEHWYHELDSINFLASGKEWVGEEFAGNPGRKLVHTFTLPFTDIIPGSVTLVSNVLSRSVGAASNFSVSANNTVVQQLSVPPTGGTPLDIFAQQIGGTTSFINNEKNITISFKYIPGGFNAQGWLNWVELFARRSLSLTGNQQLLFRDVASASNQAVTFSINNATATTQIWDVTNPLAPQKITATVNGTQLAFSNEAKDIHEYVAFSTAFLTPEPLGKVVNQDLHVTAETDYFIITHPLFATQAARLADFHQQRGLRTKVVTTEQIFNEFSAGIPDPTAVRDFIKIYYDKYRNTWAGSGKYVVLFGKTSFDYKSRINNNTAFMPCYETSNSLDPLATYTSDDFFGFLDDEEDINSNTATSYLDIGIGRIPAKTEEEASAFVDKVLAYHAVTSLGPWRNNIDFIADDEDNNLHLQDAETLISTTSATAPNFNIYKQYLDAFKQEGGSAGGRYPQANVAINNNIFNGTLIWNYSGHGGALRLAEEVVLDKGVVANWKNENRLPLFITATCDFAPFDNPTVQSLGEELIVRPKTGAIALMTTTRTVFAFSNRVMNDNYLRIALQRDSTGKY